MIKPFIRATILTAGLLHLLTGIAMLVAPEWFFQNIGTFPPYNRHYIGDLGAFQLPLGIGLLWAARAPERHRLFIAMVAVGNLIHLLNHAYDDIQADTLPRSQTVFLILFVAFLAAAMWLVQEKSASYTD